MLRGLILCVALSVAVPAAGQVGSATTPDSGQAGAAARAQSSADTVASIVDSEFPAYDANGDDQLDKAEFSRWMVALKDQEMKRSGEQLAAADVVAWTDGAFRTADTDKSISVSKPELIAYLNLGTQ